MEKYSASAHFALCLDDPATPSFCSEEKLYVGSKKDLMRVAENLSAQDNYPDTASAIRAYFEGRTNATHRIACREIPILQSVEVCDASELLLSERDWEHTNTWGFPYHMKFREAKVSQLLIRHEKRYHRCVRAAIEGFCYEGLKGDWRPIGSFILGNDSILDIAIRPDGMYGFGNILYVLEDSAKAPGELAARMRDPDAVIFDRICEEVFGDG